jgi:hypothetical protein
MSLYREVGRRRPWVVVTAVFVALAIGFVAGFAAGRSTAPEPTLEDGVAALQNEIRAATDALELVTIEYEQAVADGAVTARSEYDAARADAARAGDIFTSYREELALLSPDETAATEAALQTLTEQIENLVDPSEVTATAEEATQALRSAARL